VAEDATMNDDERHYLKHGKTTSALATLPERGPRATCDPEGDKFRMVVYVDRLNAQLVAMGRPDLTIDDHDAACAACGGSGKRPEYLVTESDRCAGCDGTGKERDREQKRLSLESAVGARVWLPGDPDQPADPIAFERINPDGSRDVGGVIDGGAVVTGTALDSPTFPDDTDGDPGASEYILVVDGSEVDRFETAGDAVDERPRDPRAEWYVVTPSGETVASGVGREILRYG
jgi:hypothetical protein